MAQNNKKRPTSRLGNDPFSWIRDTRQEEDPLGADAPQAEVESQAPEPEPAPEPPVPESKAPATLEAEAPAESAPLYEEAEVLQTVHFDAQPTDRAEAGEEALLAAIDPQQLAQLTQLLTQQAAVQQPASRRGRPRVNGREITKASQEGLPENWTRATFIVQEDLLETLKDYAYTQRMTIRDVVNEALRFYLDGKKVIRRRR